MTIEPLPTGPDPEAISRTIREAWPETDVVEAMGATGELSQTLRIYGLPQIDLWRSD